MKAVRNRLLNHLLHRCIIIVLPVIIVASIGCGNIHKAQFATGTETDLKRKLKAGENHLYTIHSDAGNFTHIKVMQYGIDVIAKAISANKQFAEQFDTPTGELDAEDIFLLGNSAGNYEIEIYPAQKYADAGDYNIKIIRNNKASENDKKWMAALVSTQKADKLRGKPETRQQSIAQYESALVLWAVLKDTVQYARAKRSMGFVYIREKNYEKAVEVFNQLLPLWNQIGDTRSAGFNLLIIGRVYDLQKNYKTSLEYNLSSLEYWIKANDPDQESFVLMNIGNLYAHLSDKQKAINSFGQALKKNELSERPSIKAVILRDYATAMLSVGENEKAIQLYEQSVQQWQATVNSPEEARTAILLAAYYEKIGKKKEAIRYYRNALGIWQKIGDQTEINKIQALLDKLEK